MVLQEKEEDKGEKSYIISVKKQKLIGSVGA